MPRLAAAVILTLALAACADALAEEPAAAPHGVMVPGGFKSFAGKVVEKLDVSQYSYLRVATGAEELWAAVPRADCKVGDPVTVENAYAMEGFESRELKRRFDVVYFGALAAAPSASDAARLAAQHTGVASGPEVQVKKLSRATGADARTVEEIWTQRASLAGRRVVVRGQVVKATPAMGKTFLHVRDGTGSAASRTNDVSVTTADAAAVGDVVTVKGTVAVDRDLGSGYRYGVLIEDATVAK
jgi:hypothetical protein